MKLNQIIAIEKGVKARAHERISILHKLNQKPAVFEGLVKEYRAKDEDGDKLPGEKKVVQARVSDIFSSLRIDTTELMNITAQKDLSNSRAEAKVSIDGTDILPALPVTTLIYLEKQLVDFRTFFAELPELDISEVWTYDENASLYRSEPVQTHRTKKTQRPIVLYDATDKHPAQTQLLTEDVIDGYWTTVRQSGAISKTEKAEILARTDKLLIAVKTAREQANGIEAAPKPPVGELVFDFLLNGYPLK